MWCFQRSPGSKRNYDSISFQCCVLFHFMNRPDLVYLLVRWSTQQSGCFYLKLLWLWALISMCLYKCLYVLISPWYVTYQWNYVVLIYLAFWKYSFSSDWLHHFKNLHEMCENSNFSTSLPACVSSVHPIKWNVSCRSFSFHFLMPNDIEHLVRHHLVSVYLLQKNFSSNLYTVFIWVFLVLDYKISLYILVLNITTKYMIPKYILPFYRCFTQILSWYILKDKSLFF